MVAAAARAFRRVAARAAHSRRRRRGVAVAVGQSIDAAARGLLARQRVVARRGDPLFDVAVGRLELAWAFGTDAMRRFTDVYRAATSVDMSALPYWELLVALRPAHYISHWAATWPDYGRPDVTSTTMRAAHRAFVEQAFAALARAG